MLGAHPKEARMKFGLYSSIASPPRGEHIDRCIDEVIDEAQLAESCGFDSCFFGEHHQDADGFLPAPLIVATAVAARTRTLRVGTSVILLPLHHPVRLAEDAITLDLVSKGRLVIGVGIGYQPADFRAFSVPMDERLARFEESVQILRLCWAGEPFSFRGKHYDLEDVRIMPRPYQKSGPPHVVQMRDAWVARTRAEAEAVYGPHVMAAYKYYWDNKLAEFRSIPAGTPFTLQNLAPNRLVLGDPETCVREFHRWQKATGAETFLLRFRHAHSGGPPHEKIMEAIKLFGERVIPNCR